MKFIIIVYLAQKISETNLHLNLFYDCLCHFTPCSLKKLLHISARPRLLFIPIHIYISHKYIHINILDYNTILVVGQSALIKLSRANVRSFDRILARVYIDFTATTPFSMYFVNVHSI